MVIVITEFFVRINHDTECALAALMLCCNLASARVWPVLEWSLSSPPTLFVRPLGM